MSDFLAAMIESSKRRAAAGRAERPWRGRSSPASAAVSSKRSRRSAWRSRARRSTRRPSG